MSLVRDSLLLVRPRGTYHLRVYAEAGGWLPLVIVGQLDGLPDGAVTVTNNIEQVADVVDELLHLSLAAGEYMLFEFQPGCAGVAPMAARFDRVHLSHDGERYFAPLWACTLAADVDVLAGEHVFADWAPGTYTTATVTRGASA